MPLSAGNVRESAAPTGVAPAASTGQPTSHRHTRIRPESSWLLDVTEVWRFRELLWTLAGRDIKVRYKQTILGVVWVVLQPLATAIIFTFVFGRLLRIPFPDRVPGLLFIFAALTGFYLFRDIVNRSGASLLSNRNLVSKIYFPRVLLPVSGVLNALVDFAVSLAVLGVIWIVLAVLDGPADATSVPAPGWSLLLWPLCLLILLMLALGFGMAATAMGALWRDVGHIVPVLLMILLYASPVMYDVGYLLDDPPVAGSALESGLEAREPIPTWQKVLYFSNPLAGLLAVYRWSLIGTGAVSWLAFVWSALSSLLMLIFGLLIFKRMERRFADVM